MHEDLIEQGVPISRKRVVRLMRAEGLTARVRKRFKCTTIMTSLNTLRAPIAHCSPLAEDEVVRFQLTVKDWFRLME